MSIAGHWCTARHFRPTELSSHAYSAAVANAISHRYSKRSQLKYTKKPYKTRNWREYEAGLCKRGEPTLWFSEEAIQAWHPNTIAKPGGQRVCSDLATKTALTVRIVYGLALRQTEGFLVSVAALLALTIQIPDHSTLSRRSKQLECTRRVSNGAGGPVRILIDSTGMKVHRGTTCPRQRGNRRAWRKLHLVVEAVSAEILASEQTTHRTRASATSQRDEHIQLIRQICRRRWQKESGYSRRSLVETAMFRYKTIIGRRLRSRAWRS